MTKSAYGPMIGSGGPKRHLRGACRCELPDSESYTPEGRAATICFPRSWRVSIDKAVALINHARPRILNYRSPPVASGALLSIGVRKPNRPCASSLVPAVKYSQLLGPAAWSLPKRIVHKRSFWIACRWRRGADHRKPLCRGPEQQSACSPHCQSAGGYSRSRTLPALQPRVHSAKDKEPSPVVATAAFG